MASAATNAPQVIMDVAAPAGHTSPGGTWRLDMLAHIAIQSVYRDISHQERRGVVHNFAEISSMGDEDLFAAFSKPCQFNRPPHHFYCWLMPKKCSWVAVSFEGEAQAKEIMKIHLRSHLDRMMEDKKAHQNFKARTATPDPEWPIGKENPAGDDNEAVKSEPQSVGIKIENPPPQAIQVYSLEIARANVQYDHSYTPKSQETDNVGKGKKRPKGDKTNKGKPTKKVSMRKSPKASPQSRAKGKTPSPKAVSGFVIHDSMAENANEKVPLIGSEVFIASTSSPVILSSDLPLVALDQGSNSRSSASSVMSAKSSKSSKSRKRSGGSTPSTPAMSPKEKEAVNDTIKAAEKRGSSASEFVCTICESEFTAYTSLMSHLKSIHLGLKPYRCNLCPLSFTRNSSLAYHNLCHTNQYLFNCDICQQGFRHRGHFKQHMDKHENATRHCPECKVPFTQKTANAYKKHLKDEHGKAVGEDGTLVTLTEEVFAKIQEKKKEPKKKKNQKKGGGKTAPPALAEKENLAAVENREALNNDNDSLMADDEVAGISKKYEENEAILNSRRIVVQQHPSESGSDISYYPATDSEFSSLNSTPSVAKDLPSFNVVSPPSTLTAPKPTKVESPNKARPPSSSSKRKIAYHGASAFEHIGGASVALPEPEPPKAKRVRTVTYPKPLLSLNKNIVVKKQIVIPVTPPAPVKQPQPQPQQQPPVLETSPVPHTIKTIVTRSSPVARQPFRRQAYGSFMLDRKSLSFFLQARNKISVSLCKPDSASVAKVDP